MNNRVDVIARSFQAGAGKENQPLDSELFIKKVLVPIRKLLSYEERVNKIIVVNNGEADNKLAEIIGSDGKTPTIRALESSFYEEIASGRMILHVCTNWGNNPGSATALNEGAALSDNHWVMPWSPEIEMDGYRITEALTLAEKNSLAVVGFMRKRWWERPQYNVVQNTASIWVAEKLKAIGGFSVECNGTGAVVHTSEFGAVPRAGMEDFHAMLRLMRVCESNFRWGLVGRCKPLHWDVNFQSGSERERNHLVKVARQYLVMRSYSEDIFKGESFEDVMDKLFACRHQD